MNCKEIQSLTADQSLASDLAMSARFRGNRQQQPAVSDHGFFADGAHCQHVLTASIAVRLPSVGRRSRIRRPKTLPRPFDHQFRRLRWRCSHRQRLARQPQSHERLRRSSRGGARNGLIACSSSSAREASTDCLLVMPHISHFSRDDGCGDSGPIQIVSCSLTSSAQAVISRSIPRPRGRGHGLMIL